MSRDVQLVGMTALVATPGESGFTTVATVGGRLVPADAARLAQIARAITGQPLADAELDALIAAGVLAEKRRRATSPGMSAAADGLHPFADETIERLALDPRLVITPAQPAQPGPTGPVRPEGALPLMTYVPPHVLGPAQELAHVLRRAWRTMIEAATARDQLVDRSRAREVLEGIAREELAASPALALAFSLGDDGRLVPRAPLQTDDDHYPVTGLGLARDRAAPELLATGARGGGVGLAPGALADVGRLFGLLHAGAGPAELAPLLRASPAAHALFGELVALGLVAPAPARGALAGEVPPGTVVHLGHAGLLANLGGAHVLIDPWLPPASSRDRVPPPAAADLPPLAAILFTHHHWDHVHAETLLALDKRAPVYVPAQPADRPLVPRTDRFLRALGFADVRALRTGDAIAIGDGGGVVAAPFTGEDPCRLGFGAACYVLVHQDRAALVHVDASPDADGRSLVSTGDAAGLAQAFGPLSPVFCTRRQERATMIEHGWEALLRPSREWVAPTENCATGAAFLAELARATGAAHLALYSEGGADWYPAFTNFIAPAGFAAHAAPYQHLWDSLDAIRAAVTTAEVHVSEPYDRFRIGGGRDGDARPRARVDRY